MRIAYVTVRYGDRIFGGAEQACRQLAEHLAGSGVQVDVHTTCATDAVTWADDFSPGTTTEAGVTVHRHRVVAGRDPDFDRFSGEVFGSPDPPDEAKQRRWLHLQGPVCPAAVDGAMASGADLVVATPYLFWPTVELMRHSDRAVMHPAAHDEGPIHLPVVAAGFSSARGLAYYTDGERRLVERLWPELSATPQAVIGLGIDPDQGRGADPARFRAALGLDDRPYLLYVGRVDDGKGVRTLAKFFTTYKRRHPGPLALVLAGAIVNPPDPHPDVIVPGPVSDADKWSAMAGASIFVNPSANESFSIVLLESWSVGTPVLVNARCPATVEHARRSHGGLAFGGYASFETALRRLLEDRRTTAAMGAAGQRYVVENFAWPVVTARYRAWLERVAASVGPKALSTTLDQS
ncbi:MAG: glycosyltransferase family 4 protein [Acidimicrobiales bacterium]